MSRKNGNGMVTLTKLFELVQNSNLQNQTDHSEIKVEIQKNRNELTERVGELKERLTKIESQPAHENFQKNFCPNTKTIEELRDVGTKGLRDYVFQHQTTHKMLEEKLDKISDEIEDYKGMFKLETKALVDMYEKKLDERDARARRALWAGIIAVLAIAVPLAVDILLTWTG